MWLNRTFLIESLQELFLQISAWLLSADLNGIFLWKGLLWCVCLYYSLFFFPTSSLFLYAWIYCRSKRWLVSPSLCAHWSVHPGRRAEHWQQPAIRLCNCGPRAGSGGPAYLRVAYWQEASCFTQTCQGSNLRCFVKAQNEMKSRSHCFSSAAVRMSPKGGTKNYPSATGVAWV